MVDMNIPCVCSHSNKYHIMYNNPVLLLAHVVKIKANKCKIMRNAKKHIIGYKFNDAFYTINDALLTAAWNIHNGIECVRDECLCKKYKRDNLAYLEYKVREKKLV